MSRDGFHNCKYDPENADFWKKTELPNKEDEFYVSMNEYKYVDWSITVTLQMIDMKGMRRPDRSCRRTITRRHSWNLCARRVLRSCTW